MKLIGKIILLVSFFIGLSGCSNSDQKADPDFVPKNTKKSFSATTSPLVFIDEAHNNFHTMNGRFKPFSQVLTSDGYTVKPSKAKFTLEHLQQADILVIANALGESRRDWTPPFNDAFDSKEVTAVKQWVTQGGSLFLIADHTPFPRASEKLSSAFGFEFSNGHVNDTTFYIENNSLAAHSISKESFASYGESQTEYIAAGFTSKEQTQVASRSEYIEQVKTFGGSAFKIPEGAKPLLVFEKGATSLVPEIPFQINAQTKRVSVAGWSRGAVLEVGKGRVAVFSEAMMFTSQVYKPTGKRMGLVSDGAEQNEQFLLNVMHWLSKKI